MDQEISDERLAAAAETVDAANSGLITPSRPTFTSIQAWRETYPDARSTPLTASGDPEPVVVSRMAFQSDFEEPTGGEVALKTKVDPDTVPFSFPRGNQRSRLKRAEANPNPLQRIPRP